MKSIWRRIVHLVERIVIRPSLIRRIRDRLVPRSDRDPRLAGRSQTWTLGEEFEVTVPDPASLSLTFNRWNPRDAGRKRIAAPSVTVVEDVDLIRLRTGAKSSIIGRLPDGLLLIETVIRPTYFAWSVGEIATDDLQTLLGKGTRSMEAPSFEVETAAVMPLELASTVEIVHNYGHWTVEIMPRLYGVARYRELTGERVTLLVPDNVPRYVEQTLQLLGFMPETDYLLTDASRIKARKFVVPSFMGADFLPNAEATDWLRETLLNAPRTHPPPEFSPFILLDRSEGGQSRAIANRDEVRAYLSDRGFAVYQPEKLSLVDQVRLFAGAQVVVSLHGSALANLIFAPHVSVLEIYGARRMPAFFRLSAAMGHDYHFLVCDQADGQITVDIDRLAPIIDEMLARRS